MFLTVVSVLYIRPSEPTHLATRILFSLPTSPCFPHPLPPGNNQSMLYFCKFSFVDSTFKWDHAIFVFVWFISHSIIPSSFTHVAAIGRTSYFLMAELHSISIYTQWNIYLNIYHIFLVHEIIDGPLGVSISWVLWMWVNTRVQISL